VTPAAVLDDIRAVVRGVDPTLPMMDVSTQVENIEKRFAQERVFAQAYTLFGALALAVAAVGLFGLMSYSVSRRTTEIGIRMALGAQSGDVLGLVMKESMALVALGVAAGVTIAVAAGRLVATLLFGLAPTDPLTLAAAVTVMTGVAALAGFLPARRASRVDPMVALRTE
jgi:ABC-type antimicrobial peptide transport system permease subunit